MSYVEFVEADQGWRWWCKLSNIFDVIIVLATNVIPASWLDGYDLRFDLAAISSWCGQPGRPMHSAVKTSFIQYRNFFDSAKDRNRGV